MRIAVTGRKGQVTQALLERGLDTGFEIVAVGRPAFDLTSSESVERALLAIKPEVIVSTAAYTAVDRAESDSRVAFATNATGAGLVATVAARIGAPIIHLSTDYVFAGNKLSPYLETDKTGPISVYGLSKLEGEKLVAAANQDHVILRTAWIYSPFGVNFLKTMLKLAESRSFVRVVADQKGQPTSALDIATAIFAIATRLKEDSDPRLRGIFHLTGGGEATWADFAEWIFAGLARRTGRSVSVERIATTDYPTAAKRPANSVLSNDKLIRTYGVALPEWRRSTEELLDRLVGRHEGRTA